MYGVDPFSDGCCLRLVGLMCPASVPVQSLLHHVTLLVKEFERIFPLLLLRRRLSGGTVLCCILL